MSNHRNRISGAYIAAVLVSIVVNIPACHAGDWGSIPRRGGNTLFGSSLVTQRLKRLPGMRETWVRSLGREDPLEKEMATHPLQYSCLENPMEGGTW